MGFEDEVEHSVGLVVRLTVGPADIAISPHPSSREGHHATARWSSRFSYANPKARTVLKLMDTSGT